MRIVLVLVMGMVNSAACITKPESTLQEHCATTEMILEGISSTSTSVAGRATAFGRGGVVTVGSHAEEDSSNVTCRRPTTREESCELTAAQASLQVKLNFDTDDRNGKMALGYLLFLIPGMVLHAEYNNDREKAERKAADVYGQTLAACTLRASVNETKPANPQAQPPPHPPQASERKIVEGSKPLHCALVVSDADSGLCFLDEPKCTEIADSHHGDTTYGSCVVRNAGACFNVDVVLDGQRVAICAPSISDCEKRLAAARVNPDYTVNAAQCGVYRLRQAEPRGSDAKE